MGGGTGNNCPISMTKDGGGKGEKGKRKYRTYKNKKADRKRPPTPYTYKYSKPENPAGGPRLKRPNENNAWGKPEAHKPYPIETQRCEYW